MKKKDQYFYYGKLVTIYGKLLTDHQKNVCENYYHYDLSLAEISEQLSISRTAVSEILKLSRLKLDEFEAKLHLYEKETVMTPLLKRLLDQSSESQQEIINQIEDIIKHGI